MKRKKKIQKGSFVQGWGTYPNQTLVCVGLTHEEIIRKLQALKGKPEFIEWAKKEKIGEDAWEREDKGFFAHNHGASILWLKHWDGGWEMFEVLIHELHHAAFMILGKNKCMPDEWEAQAYQQEFLFREIRRKLYKMFP